MTDAQKRAHAELVAAEMGQPVEAVLALLEETLAAETWMNSRYQVDVRRIEAIGEVPAIVHLSIKRRDKVPVGAERYRDFMRLKDELVGPECEAVELYPARSREVDTVTQYHLWAVPNPYFRFPIGWDGGRLIATESGASGATQNPFEEHHAR